MTTPKQPIPSRVHADKFTGDARTVLPGQPVTYHVTDPAAIKRIQGGMREAPGSAPFSLGTPIPVQPDPSKIVGVFDPRARAAREPEPPPVPPAGFYWARLYVEDCWAPVEVIDNGVRVIVGLDPSDVTEWGPALYPPGSGVALDDLGKCTGCAVPIRRGNGVNHVGDRPWHTQCLVRSLTGTVEALQQRYDERKAQRLTYVEAQLLKGALGAALLPAPFGFEPEVSRKLTGEEHAALEAAIERAMVQPAECRHDAWEWPMARCPACGTEGR